MIEDREKIERLRGGEDATFHSIYFKYYEEESELETGDVILNIMKCCITLRFSF